MLRRDKIMSSKLNFHVNLTSQTTKIWSSWLVFMILFITAATYYPNWLFWRWSYFGLSLSIWWFILTCDLNGISCSMAIPWFIFRENDSVLVILYRYLIFIVHLGADIRTLPVPQDCYLEVLFETTNHNMVTSFDSLKDCSVIWWMIGLPKLHEKLVTSM